jgi:hypothetical protein
MPSETNQIPFFYNLDISLPKSSRRETRVPLKYRMDGDYTSDGKVYCHSIVASIATKEETLPQCNSGPQSEHR